MTIQEIHIRNANLSDLNRIIELENISFEFDAFSEYTLKAYLENCSELFFVAESTISLVGYVIATIQSQKGLIVSIAVNPKHRRQGVGRALSYKALNYLKSRKVKIVELHVRKTNEQGLRFWKDIGFLTVRTIPNFYSDSTEAILMKKVLF